MTSIMIIQIVKLKTGLSEEELLSRARDREPQFKALPGLLQKYYVKLEKAGEYGGVYLWDSIESLQEFRQSELAASIAAAYEVTSPPDIELLDVIFKLR